MTLDTIRTAAQSLLISAIIVGSWNLVKRETFGGEIGYGARVSLKIDDAYMGDLNKSTYARYDKATMRDEWIYRANSFDKSENFQLGLHYNEHTNYRNDVSKYLYKFNRLKYATLEPASQPFKQMTAIGEFEFLKFAMSVKNVSKQCIVFISDEVAEHAHLRGYYCAADKQKISTNRLSCILSSIESDYLPIAAGVPPQSCT